MVGKYDSLKKRQVLADMSSGTIRATQEFLNAHNAGSGQKPLDVDGKLNPVVSDSPTAGALNRHLDEQLQKDGLINSRDWGVVAGGHDANKAIVEKMQAEMGFVDAQHLKLSPDEVRAITKLSSAQLAGADIKAVLGGAGINAAAIAEIAKQSNSGDIVAKVHAGKVIDGHYGDVTEAAWSKHLAAPAAPGVALGQRPGEQPAAPSAVAPAQAGAALPPLATPAPMTPEQIATRQAEIAAQAAEMRQKFPLPVDVSGKLSPSEVQAIQAVREGHPQHQAFMDTLRSADGVHRADGSTIQWPSKTWGDYLSGSEAERSKIDVKVDGQHTIVDLKEAAKHARGLIPPEELKQQTPETLAKIQSGQVRDLSQIRTPADVAARARSLKELSIEQARADTRESKAVTAKAEIEPLEAGKPSADKPAAAAPAAKTAGAVPLPRSKPLVEKPWVSPKATPQSQQVMPPL